MVEDTFQFKTTLSYQNSGFWVKFQTIFTIFEEIFQFKSTLTFNDLIYFTMDKKKLLKITRMKDFE